MELLKKKKKEKGEGGRHQILLWWKRQSTYEAAWSFKNAAKSTKEVARETPLMQYIYLK